MTMHGGTGNDDFLYNESLSPFLFGDSGSDVFEAGDQTSVASIDGGDGFDTEEFNAGGEVFTTVAPNVEKFESLGADFAEDVTANNLGDIIELTFDSLPPGVTVVGGAGNDTITASYSPSWPNRHQFASVQISGGLGNDSSRSPGRVICMETAAKTPSWR